MRSDRGQRPPLLLGAAAIGGVLFLHAPLLLIFVYAFTTEEKSYQFPPPGYTLKWFGVAWSQRPDIWPPLYLSLEVAAIATVTPMGRKTSARGCRSASTISRSGSTS